MKKQKKTIKINFFKKLFVKFCRFFNFEIIDQNDLFLPVSNKSYNDNLSKLGKESLVLPMGRIKISRPVKSLDIILRTCSSVNMLSQSKKRIFEKTKDQYSLRTLNSLIRSINKSQLTNKIKIKLTIIDHNSSERIKENFLNLLKNQNFESEIKDLEFDYYKRKIKNINQDGKEVTTNQMSNMSNINQSFNLAKDCEDLVYFVEDDYLHKLDAIEEMVYTFERISSILKKDIILCPADYPYLYNNLNETKIMLGNKYHWRSIHESLCTFLTSKEIVNEYWQKFISTCEFEHNPFEKPFHDIYREVNCFSPLPSLAVHYTNINSIYGLSPNTDYKKLWDENEIE